MDGFTITSLLMNLTGFLIGVPVGALWGIKWARSHHVTNPDKKV